MAITFPQGPNIAQEAGQAAVAGPLSVAEQQQKMAEAKAGAQLAPIAVEERQADLQKARLQADTGTLGRISQLLTVNPTLAKSPVLLKSLTPVFQRLGVPVPTDATGALDIPSLQSMTAAPMTAPGVQHVVDSVDKVVKEFEDPKTLMTPGQFGAALKSKYDLLMHTGNVAEAQSLLAYITPDGKPSPEYQQRVISQYVQAQINHLDALGVHIADRDQLAHDIADERAYEFDTNQNRLNYQFGERMKREDTRIRNQAEATRQRLADAQQRLGISRGNADLAKQRFQQTSDMHDLTAYRAILTSTAGQLNTWRTQLNTTIADIRQMTSSQLKSKEGQDLVAQAAELKRLIDSNQQSIEAEMAGAQQGIGQAAAAITGHPTTVDTPKVPAGLPPDFATRWRSASAADKAATLADKRLTPEQRAYIQSLK